MTTGCRIIYGNAGLAMLTNYILPITVPEKSELDRNKEFWYFTSFKDKNFSVLVNLWLYNSLESTGIWCALPSLSSLIYKLFIWIKPAYTNASATGLNYGWKHSIKNIINNKCRLGSGKELFNIRNKRISWYYFDIFFIIFRWKVLNWL